MDLPHKKTLILGLGSEALTDDGVPILLIADLKKVLDPQKYDMKTTAVGGMEIIDLVQGYKAVILIDTTKSPAGKPGTVYKSTSERHTDTYNLSSQHDLGFSDALKLGKMLNLEMPGKIYILAIEISENRTLSTELSQVMSTCYPGTFYEILEFIMGLSE